MFNTIFDLVQDPTNSANWAAFFETLLSLVAVVAGIAAIVCCSALAPLGLIVAALGTAGLVFGYL
ncbi:MAG: hypothetical protein LIO70_09180 [Clostridiales bacterium]|nr:hypothetical protein [Clostridiales bacterium]